MTVKTQSTELATASVDDGKRVIDLNPSTTINPEDKILIDSVANGARAISYETLCQAVAVTLGIANIKDTADSAMQISTYDKNRNGKVDNAEALNGHSDSYFATADNLKDVSKVANAAMPKTTYDSDNDGVVDNAAKVNNHTVESNVPANAVFTDTLYNDTAVKQSIADNANAIKLKANGQNITFSVTSGGLLNVKQEV